MLSPDFEAMNGVVTGQALSREDYRVDKLLKYERGIGWQLQRTELGDIHDFLVNSVKHDLPESLVQGLQLRDLFWYFLQADGLTDVVFFSFDHPSEPEGDWQEARAVIQVNRRAISTGPEPVFRESLGISGVQGERLVVAGYDLEPAYRSQHDFRLQSLAVSVKDTEIKDCIDIDQWRARQYGSVLMSEYFHHQEYYLLPALVTAAMWQKAGRAERLMELTRAANGVMVFKEQMSPDGAINEADYFSTQFDVFESGETLNLTAKPLGLSTLNLAVPRHLPKIQLVL